MDVQPRILHGRALVPISALAKVMRASVSWDPSSRTVVFGYGVGDILVTVGDKKAVAKTHTETKVVDLGRPVIIVGGRVLVTVRTTLQPLVRDIYWIPAGPAIEIRLQ